MVCSGLVYVYLTQVVLQSRTGAQSQWCICQGCHVLGQVRVLGETYTPEDEEDSTVAEVSNVWVYQARYRVPLPKATAGAHMLLLLSC